jgi:hypothetical protein
MAIKLVNDGLGKVRGKTKKGAAESEKRMWWLLFFA